MKTFKCWLNSGANCHSEYSVVVTTDELGLTDEEYDSLSEDEKEEMFREIAFEQSEWGFKEV